MADKIRVLVVDDSALMRKRISDILNSDSGIKVAGTARDGKDALMKVAQFNPDVITMDVEMPVMDGLTCLGHIVEKYHIPVIMLSAYTQYDMGETTIRALELGAVDFVGKPSGTISLDIKKTAEELISKIKIAAGVDKNKIKGETPKQIKRKKRVGELAIKKIITIGASTGGPKSLAEIIPNFPAGFNASILIVQHMPEGFTESLAKRLSLESEIKVKEAQDGDPIKNGAAYIAPGDFHMIVENMPEGGVIRLNKEPKELGIRPSINITMRSAASVYGEKNIGVVLTGMGSDGTNGLRAIKRAGGATIAQDAATSIVYGMPKSAVDAGVVDKIVPLHLIADEIIRMVGE